jgi:hypothetical protein
LRIPPHGLDHRGDVLVLVPGRRRVDETLARRARVGQFDALGRESFHRVSQILDHERHQEVGRVVARHHPFDHHLHDGTSGRSGGQYIGRAANVEAAALGHGDGLAQARELHAAHEIVDELEQRAASGRTHVHLAAAHGREQRGGAFGRRRLAAHEKIQRALFGLRFAAGDRRVEKTDAARRGQGAELAHPSHRERARFDGQGVTIHRRQRARLAQPHGARGVVIGEHRDDRLGAARGVGRCRRDSGAGSCQRVRAAGVAVPDGEI